jgi:hypothetical protein
MTKCYGLWSIDVLWDLIRNQFHGHKFLWLFTDYGLLQPWVMTELTVVPFPLLPLIHLLALGCVPGPVTVSK